MLFGQFLARHLRSCRNDLLILATLFLGRSTLYSSFHHQLTTIVKECARPGNRTCKTPEHAAKNWAVKYQWIASIGFIDF